MVELGPNQFVEGREDEATGQRQFLGIPFAEPPVDDLRWKAPVAKTAWSGTFNATRFGNTCLQGKSLVTSLGTELSEDCLYLNVWAPPVKASVPTASGLAPVLVYFYGGSWMSGSGTVPLYWGQSLVGNSGDPGEGTIVVTLNYRLGTFGFLGGEALRDDDAQGGSKGTTGNWGLLDQRESLKWVQRHIASFGGDPKRVTIFGESAGAGSVAAHFVSSNSYASQAVDPTVTGPLFVAAISESGSPFAPWSSQSMSVAETRLSHVAQNVGCVTAPPTSPVGPSVVECLRTKSGQELLDARHNVGGLFLDWSPVEDGVELLGSLRGLMRAGLFAGNVSYLTGTNADEGSEFIDLSYDASEAEYEAYMVETLGDELGNKALAEYPFESYNGTEDGKKPGHGGFWAMARAVTDGMFSCPARATARAVAGGAGGAGAASAAYLYFFNHSLQLVDTAAKVAPEAVEPLGVFHGSELPFVFDFEIALRTQDETDLALTFNSFWTSFAASQDPNGGGGSLAAASWPAYTPTGDEAMLLATPAATEAKPEAGLKKTHCDFWDLNPIPEDVIFGTPEF